MNITRQAVKFDNHGHKIAGILRIPEDAQEKNNAALVSHLSPEAAVRNRPPGFMQKKWPNRAM